jgi:hypothetical protein
MSQRLAHVIWFSDNKPHILVQYTYKLEWRQIVNLYRLTLPEEPPIGTERRTQP